MRFDSDHLEELAGVHLDAGERSALRGDLERIVEFVARLPAAEAAGLAVAAATAATRATYRADRVAAWPGGEEALAAAPAREGAFFAIRAPERCAGRSSAPLPGVPPCDGPSPPAYETESLPPDIPAPATAPGVRHELTALSGEEIACALRRGETDRAAILAAHRCEISRWDRILNALTCLAPAGTKPPAARAAVRGPLQGTVGLLKANLAWRGWPLECGSRLLAGHRAVYTATAAARAVAAGATFVGTTTMDEFGMGSSTEHAAGGAARNPWSLRHVPGGSSGGAAAAVAAGLATFALGSDTGGSLRQPAHCCGLVGVKPTYGRVSRSGLVAFASSLDTVGVLARDVGTAAAVLATILGGDPRDATSWDVITDSDRGRGGDRRGLALTPPLHESGGRRAPDRGSASGWRLGVPWSVLEPDLPAATAGMLHEILRELRSLGAAVRAVEVPAWNLALPAYTVIAAAEAASNLARFDGSLYGVRRRGDRGYHGDVRTTRGRGFGAEIKRRILLGTFVLAAGYRARFYARAQAARRQLTADFATLWRDCDAVVLPTAPEAAFPLGARVSDPLRMYRSDLWTVPASLAGLPALSLPGGRDPTGLPLGLQLIGPPGGETALLRLASLIERIVAFGDGEDLPWRR